MEGRICAILTLLSPHGSEVLVLVKTLSTPYVSGIMETSWEKRQKKLCNK